MKQKMWNFIKNNRIFLLLLLVDICLSFILRFPYLRDTTWEWRPAQTFMTAFWFNKEGISLFSYQTPVLGPPWQVPLEFPIYQVLGAIIAKLGVHNLTVACHLASLIAFYASSIFLILLCLEYFDSKLAAFLVFTVYLWLPFDIRYSTDIQIDYTSVAFALGYIYFLKKWLDQPQKYYYGISGIFFGCLSGLVKTTTLAIVIVPSALLVIHGVLKQAFRFNMLIHPRELVRHILEHKIFWLILVGVIFTPILVAALWTRYSDGIKLANPFTAFLSSGNLLNWTYGTLAQKTSFANWWAWILKTRENFLFGGLILFPIIGIASLYKTSLKSREFFGSSLVGSLLTIFIFFNLYRHDYYYMAISAFMSILIGYGIYCFVHTVLTQKKYWWFIFLTILLFFIVMQGGEKIQALRKASEDGINAYKSQIVPLARKVRKVTAENEYVISIQNDWYPQFLLATERKGLTFEYRAIKVYTCELLNQYNYTTVVGPADSAMTKAVLSCFKHSNEIEPGIYKVSNTD